MRQIPACFTASLCGDFDIVKVLVVRWHTDADDHVYIVLVESCHDDVCLHNGECHGLNCSCKAGLGGTSCDKSKW